MTVHQSRPFGPFSFSNLFELIPLLLSDLANNRTDKESPQGDLVSETTNPAVIDGKMKFPTPPQVQGKGPPTGTNQTVAPPDKVTKEALNTIWNALKQNPSDKGLPGVPNLASIEPPRPAVDTNAVVIDFTESLRKCLKITPSSEAVATPEKIQQPSPAQLPPPPASWRMEAQIKHLGATKPTENRKTQSQPQPPLVNQGPPQAPQGHGGIIRPNRPPPGAMGLFGAPPLPRFGSGAPPPRPYFQHPPMVHPPNGVGFPRMPVNNGGGGPMQGYPMPPFNNNMGPQGRPMRPPHWQPQQFFQNHHHPPQNQQQQQHRMAGPQTLSNASGNGAFIPLQAARKITKLKSNNSNRETVKPGSKKTEENKNPVAAQDAGASAKVDSKAKSGEVAVKKTPKPKKDPKPARIAANFSMAE